mmetsp:Transcript_20145/g.65074  ORF Transcript_20145/g.65074 Transcript_20145/m.65074 type:complete len:456 (+) Transcript_20145:482-1849(+)
MAVDPIDESVQKGVLTQRLMANHKWENINLQSISTKAADLCQGLVYNALGTYYGNVAAYRSPQPALGGILIPGKDVCAVAVFIWILSMTSEIRRICEVGLAIIRLDNAKKGQVQADVDVGEDVFMIKRKGVINKVVVCVVVLIPRMFIAIILLIYGAIYLANTLAVTDMILNACALEIVKDIDEYLFEAIMSHRVRELIEGTRFSYRSPKKETLRGQVEEIVPIMGRLIFVTVVFGIAWAGPLTNFETQVDDFNSWVCEHDLNFAWINHPVIGLPFFTSLDRNLRNISGPIDAEQLRCFYQAHSLMLETRSGFTGNPLSDATSGIENTTLASKFRGDHPDCSKTGGGGHNPTCPNVPVGFMINLASLAASDIYSSPDCADYDLHLQVLATTCGPDKYGSRIFVKSDGSVRSECSDFEEFSACPVTLTPPQSKCSPENYTSTMEKYKINYVWIPSQ